ncbi:MAG: oxygenase MpaB family protein [Candidatus Dormibacteria bacterium]
MSVPLPSLREIHFLAGLPAVRRRVAYPLRDTAKEPGLFGPHSVTWRVLATPLLVLGGSRALLMQVANPLVAQGVLDHSNVREDPFRRLTNTVTWVYTVAFGTGAEADRAIRRLRAVHERVRGTLAPENATVAYRAGTPYAASHPTLMLWVHATLIDSMLVLHESLLSPLSIGDGNRFVREWNPVAERLGVDATSLWQTREGMRAYIAAELSSGRVTPGEGSREVADTILESPLPGAPGLVWPMLHLFSIALLGDRLRDGYGLEWNAAQRVAHRALRGLVSGVLRLTPAQMRSAKVATYAGRRTRGQFRHVDPA